MARAHTFLITIPCAVLAVNSLCASDLSSYREVQFGMNLPAVAKVMGVTPSEAKLIHQRPAMIQELAWQPGSFPTSLVTGDTVKDLRFGAARGS